jgi:DDE superfamily endonuclease
MYSCLDRRADELFELTDAVLCAEGPVRSLVGLCLAPEHRRGHGTLYDALSCGRVDGSRPRVALSGLSVVVAIDVFVGIPWLAAAPQTGVGRDAVQAHGMDGRAARGPGNTAGPQAST